jgi:hypothetical protein
MRQIKTPIAGNSQSKAGPMSGASVLGLAKIGNAAMRRSELAYFNKQMLIHELIRGSLATHCRFPAYVADKECHSDFSQDGSLDSCRVQVRLTQVRLTHTRLTEVAAQ